MSPLNEKSCNCKKWQDGYKIDVRLRLGQLCQQRYKILQRFVGIYLMPVENQVLQRIGRWIACKLYDDEINGRPEKEVFYRTVVSFCGTVNIVFDKITRVGPQRSER